MKKYKVIITRWKSEIVNAEGIDNYAAEDKVVLWRHSSMGGNPVVTAPQECRDPKVFWNEEAGCWNCVLVSPLEYEAWFYTSKDLKNWTKESEFGGHGVTSAIWECPDLRRTVAEN